MASHAAALTLYPPTRLLLPSMSRHSIKRVDGRAWYQGPRFEYQASPKAISVNVVGSSWTIKGVALANAVVDVLTEFRKTPGHAVLDFGAGTWLRYVDCIRRLLPTRDLYAVEYGEAFEREEPAAGRRALEADVTFLRPSDFLKDKTTFDLILCVNVLNVIPEEPHRRAIFQKLVQRLNPRGRLVVYQRIWPAYDNPPEAIPYGDDGWFVPQPRYDYFTYRAGTGALWFRDRAKEAGLREASTKAEISASNTFFRVWEKPFA